MKHHRPVSTLPAPSANPNLSINNLPNLTQPPRFCSAHTCAPLIPNDLHLRITKNYGPFSVQYRPERSKIAANHPKWSRTVAIPSLFCSKKTRLNPTKYALC
jgi:hypothetical protein